ncbi:tRNA pseudouridine(13) synthase TruD [Patescibacteria group bacterium]|nr:tRNA pseudouridine(13) synthase TruD [Patescibacteria group bacterium]
MSNYQAWQRQNEIMNKIRRENPELVTLKNPPTEDEMLVQIGVTSLPPDRPRGYLRLYPQDFIVEEIHSDGEISPIEPSEPVDLPDPPEQKFTLWADMIKVGVPTQQAVRRLAEALKINEQQIGYAGLKDAAALTSQQITLSRTLVKDVVDKKVPSVHLTRFAYGKGAIQPGDLQGNRFTIYIRTDQEYSEEKLARQLEQLEQEGFLNYYQTQRFGGIRLHAHVVGCLIFQGQYEDAVKYFLTAPGSFDIPLIKKIRAEAAKHYGQWDKMKEYFNRLPYIFKEEIRLVEYLVQSPQDFVGALIHVQDQTKMWIYAYDSFVFNRYLSRAAKDGKELPAELPSLLSPIPEDNDIYFPWLKEENTVQFRNNLRPFKFIRLKRRMVATKIYPQVGDYKVLPTGVLISFDLPKAAYATTFLTHIFQLTSAMPIPEWVNKDEVDLKAELGTGSVAAAKEVIGEYIHVKPGLE